MHTSRTTELTQPTAKSSTKAADTCAAQEKLADGIDANIKVQEQELKDVADVKKAVQANDKGQFATTHKALLATIDKGVSIRENNQKIAPAGNDAIPGLKVVRAPWNRRANWIWDRDEKY